MSAYAPGTLPASTLAYHTTPASKEDILKLVAKYYGEDKQRRGTMKSASGAVTGCVYINDAGQRCAVGLFCDVSLIHAQDMGQGVLDWTFTEMDDVVMDNYRGHEKNFWSDVQSFHDHAGNFDKIGGLTQEGEDILHNTLENWDALPLDEDGVGSLNPDDH